MTENVLGLNATSPNPYYLTAEAIVFLIAVPGNILVIASFYRTRTLHRYSNYFIITLGLSDLSVATLSIPFCMGFSMGYPRNKSLYPCLTCLILHRFALSWSMFSYILVTFDRWWAIAYPFSYQRKMYGKAFTRALCSCPLTLAAILACLQYAGLYNLDGWHSSNEYCFFRKLANFYYHFVCNVVLVFGSMIIIICIYIYIYRVIKKQQNLQYQQMKTGRADSRTCDDVASHIFITKFNRDALLAIRLGKIVLIFLLFNLPLATLFTIWTFCSQEKCPLWPELLPSAVVIIHANAAVNPFLYAYHLPDFRKAMKDTIWSLAGQIRKSIPLSFSSNSTNASTE